MVVNDDRFVAHSSRSFVWLDWTREEFCLDDREHDSDGGIDWEGLEADWEELKADGSKRREQSLDLERVLY